MNLHVELSSQASESNLSDVSVSAEDRENDSNSSTDNEDAPQVN